jgi:predicted RNA binding protein YcfA (HicA-like mRNA interferase family)
MPKLPHVTGREILAALLRAGFTEAHVRGAHHYLRRGAGRLVVVPVHAGETVPPGNVEVDPTERGSQRRRVRRAALSLAGMLRPCEWAVRADDSGTPTWGTGCDKPPDHARRNTRVRTLPFFNFGGSGRNTTLEQFNGHSQGNYIAGAARASGAVVLRGLPCPPE